MQTQSPASPARSVSEHRLGSSFLTRLAPPALAVAASAACWAVVFAAVPPSRQDFPLGDDWAFSRGLFSVVRGDGPAYFEFAALPQLGQWLWAVPFVKVFGEAHWALRLSTILLSWLAVVAFHGLLRMEGIGRGRAALAAATLALNPLVFLSTGTYMTDVPTLAFSLAALALYARALWRPSPLALVAAVAAATLGAVTRQNAVVVSIVAAVLLWRSPERRRRPLWLLAVALPAAVAVGAHLWFQARSDGQPARFVPQPPELILMLPFLVGQAAGLACLPVLAIGEPPRERRAFAGALAFMLGSAAYWAWHNRFIPSFDKAPYFPYMIPMLGPRGPFTGHFVVGEGVVLLGTSSRIPLTLLGCVAGAWLFARWAEHRRAAPPGPLELFTLVQAALLLVAPSLYDRYLEVLLPGALLAAARARLPRPTWRAAGVGLLAGQAVLAVCLMHDWLAWNSARWELGRKALARGIPAWDVEGGFEWDGWHGPRRKPPAPPAHEPPRGLDLVFTRNNFWWVTGRYALAFAPQPNAVVEDRQPYRLWLNHGAPDFYLLRFLGPTAP